MSVYADDVLKKVQHAEFSILKDFVEICEKEKFRYYIDAGSLLGAVRHKGFIPWDDDIDVAMPRKDYMLFLDYAKRNLSEKYNILNIYEYDNYPLTTTQLALKGTKFVVEPFKDIKDVPFGIYLDIFPMDFVSDDEKKMWKQIKKAFVYGKLMILVTVKKPYVPYKGFKRGVVHIATTCVHYILKLFGVSGRKLNNRIERITRNEESGTGKIKYMNAESVGVLLADWDDVFPTVPVEFCGLTVQAPRDYDKYLRNYYGDYMKLPPEDKRKTHSPMILDFGEYSFD